MKPESHAIIDSDVRFHDRHRFEMKLDVDLYPKRENKYRVEMYFFVPKALNITPATYSKQAFYSSTQRFIRFKTPKMRLDMVMDQLNSLSPLFRVRQALPGLLNNTADDAAVCRVVDEIKLLGCTVKGYVRDFSKFLIAEVRALNASPQDCHVRISSVEEYVEDFVGDSKEFISSIRALRGELANPVIPEKLRSAYAFFDEFLSLTMVEYFSELLKVIRGAAHRDAFMESDKAINAFIRAQDNYRKTMGYPSIVGDGRDNEILIYRRGVLKKFISSVLHLQIETSEWEGTYQVLFGLSAGAAMLFTLLVMIFAQSRWAFNSVPFVLFAVTSYIFKDRIKDWLKAWFAKNWTRWIADRQHQIKDPYLKERIGTFKEAFSFLAERKVPSYIRSRRNIDNITSIDEEGKPEMVLKYEKEVILYPDRMVKKDERTRDLNDIFRFNVLPFLAQADDPYTSCLHLNQNTNEVENVLCARVYHVNVVTQYITYDAEGEQQVRFERVRLVLDREGIKRLEEVPVA
ncbi:MAG: hypothetical protein PHW69_02110 [Elusimicrobiaceae bacterium]|nr:hypothetical protein [Elusimicrobiaceae bacterium]